MVKNNLNYDMFFMSMEAFEDMQFERALYLKLQEAEKEASLTGKRFSSKNVLKEIQTLIKECKD